jgi:hypothetical protein
MAELEPEMSDISHVTLTGRPLIVSDVDDVVLQFIAPFEFFLEAQGLKFIPRSFRLAGNIVRTSDMEAVEDTEIKRLLHAFFESQDEHQSLFEHALTTLTELAKEADIIFLTAMPPQFADLRRKHLADLGLPFPLIATEKEKGPVLASLATALSAPVVFVDDMAHNLASVEKHLPHCLLLNLFPQSEVHRLAPRPPQAAFPVNNWPEAAVEIRKHFASSEAVEIGAEIR